MIYNGIKIDYELTIKNVKNLNLRVKSNGKICVSANEKVSNKVIDDFVIKNGEFILRAIKILIIVLVFLFKIM